MADSERKLTIAEYIVIQRRKEAENGVVLPEIPADVTFVIDEHFFQILRETQFFGYDDEDALEHVKDIEEITDLINIVGVTKDAKILRVFPITLQGPAKRWLRCIRPRTIRTWEELKTKFVEDFSPPFKIGQKFHQCPSLIDSSVRKKPISESNDELSVLDAKVDDMILELKKTKQLINGIRVDCDICKTHIRKEYLFDANENKKAEVCYFSGDEYDVEPRHNNWRPDIEYQEELEGRYKRDGPECYQKNSLERLEDMVARFVEESDKRHLEMKEWGLLKD